MNDFGGDLNSTSSDSPLKTGKSQSNFQSFDTPNYQQENMNLQFNDSTINNRPNKLHKSTSKSSPNEALDTDFNFFEKVICDLDSEPKYTSIPQIQQNMANSLQQTLFTNQNSAFSNTDLKKIGFGALLNNKTHPGFENPQPIQPSKNFSMNFGLNNFSMNLNADLFSVPNGANSFNFNNHGYIKDEADLRAMVDRKQEFKVINEFNEMSIGEKKKSKRKTGESSGPPKHKVAADQVDKLPNAIMEELKEDELLPINSGNGNYPRDDDHNQNNKIDDYLDYDPVSFPIDRDIYLDQQIENTDYDNLGMRQGYNQQDLHNDKQDFLYGAETAFMNGNTSKKITQTQPTPSQLNPSYSFSMSQSNTGTGTTGNEKKNSMQKNFRSMLAKVFADAVNNDYQGQIRKMIEKNNPNLNSKEVNEKVEEVLDYVKINIEGKGETKNKKDGKKSDQYKIRSIDTIVECFHQPENWIKAILRELFKIMSQPSNYERACHMYYYQNDPKKQSCYESLLLHREEWTYQFIYGKKLKKSEMTSKK